MLLGLGGALLVGDRLDVERERANLLDQHLEGLGDAGVGHVLALDDRLVGLDATVGVIGLDREDLLQHVGGSVGVERPHLHLAEALAAELGLAAEGLLRDEAVGARRARMDLIVDHVAELQDVAHAHGDLVAEGLAGAAVVERGLAKAVELRHELLVHVVAKALAGAVDEVDVGATDSLGDLVGGGAVEDRRGDRHGAGHVGLGVGVIAVPAVGGSPTEVALEQLAHVHTARDAQRVEQDVDGRAVGHVGHVLDRQDAADHALVAVTARDLVALLDLAALCHEDADELVDSGREVVAGLAAEAHHVDDAAVGAVRHLEGGVAHVVGFGAEDGTEQALLRGERRLALGRDLADQDVTRAHLGSDADDSVIVEVGEHILAQVRDLAGNLLRAELGVAGVDLVTGDVHRGEQVVAHDALGHDDAVLVVVALPRHVGHGEVGAEGELGVVDRGAVGERLAGHHVVAGVDDRAVVDARGLVGALVLGQLVALGALGGVDHEVRGVDFGNGALVLGADDVAGIERGAGLHAGAHERGVGVDQGHGLALHVGAHERTLGVVMLEERDERGGH